jgi:hypothetical protein
MAAPRGGSSSRKYVGRASARTCSRPLRQGLGEERSPRKYPRPRRRRPPRGSASWPSWRSATHASSRPRAPGRRWHRGLGPQRVRQLATQAGWSLVRREPLRYQCVCGRVQRGPSLCDDCRFVELPCEDRGKLKRVSAAQLVWKVTRFPRPLNYTGRVFCGRPCMGGWVARNRRKRRPVAALQQLPDVLEQRFPARLVPHGTWNALAREIGMSRGC